ncbi:septum site-determining protein MinC [Okeanomitos corallinicola TIOX110]|uniref:Probable septum site-determining protein MinC n=1 Tax=Okeanomitos corallinicola TIOX110 TaxID=3133117 RepID=A0ABZ2UTH3_9CYAN
MNSDSIQPSKNLDKDLNSELADPQSILDIQEEEKNYPGVDIQEVANSKKDHDDPVIPDQDVNSVLVYLQGQKSEDQNSDFLPNSEKSENIKEGESNSELIDMDLDLDIDLNSNDLELAAAKNKNIQVQFKTQDGKLSLILPRESELPASEVSWSEIWQQMRQRLNGSDRLRTANTTVNLIAKDRLLDSRQLQELAETLKEVKLELKSVSTSRRQTAIAACTLGYSVEQVQLQPSFVNDPLTTAKPLADALYLEMTVRSGAEIRHPGTVIILGDINPGGMVIADGDIIVWGRLRGVAHAGAGGNRECLIMALQMEPTQLRIADAVARSPEKSLTQFFPEVAHITPQGIRIAKATDFSRTPLSKINQSF